MKDYPTAKYGDTPSSVRTAKEKESGYESVQSTAMSKKCHPDSTLELAYTKSTVPSATAYEHSDVAVKPDIDVGSLTRSSSSEIATESSKDNARKYRSFPGKIFYSHEF